MMFRSPLSAVAALMTCMIMPGRAESPAEARVPQLARGVNLSRWFWNAHPADPAQNPDRFSDAEFTELVRLGFTCVRLNVDYWTLEGENSGQLIEALHKAVTRLRKAGLAVIVDIHNQVENSKGEELNERLETDEAFLPRYLATVEKLAAAIHSWGDPDSVFLELMNEPVFAKNPDRWKLEILPAAIQAARRAAPDTTLVICGNEWAGIQNIVGMKPEDSNVIFSFHYYDPMTFTHQGAEWGERSPLAGVPYPPDPIALSKVAERSPAKFQRELKDYSKQEWGPKRMLDLLEDGIGWARKQNIPIVCTEFGAYQRKAPKPDLERWHRETRETLEGLGIGWILWSYDEEAFGLVSRGKDGMKFNKGLLEALRPQDSKAEIPNRDIR